VDEDFLRVRVTEAAARYWWLFLVTGVIWLTISLIVFRFDTGSATTIGILTGVVLLVIGVLDLASAPLLEGVWRWVSGILGAIFLVAGFAALVYPDKTFLAVASILAWVLLFKGIYDIVISLATRDIELWWLRLIVGILEIALAFWAAQGLGRSAALLVAIVGVLALFRGVTDIFMAFQLRDIAKRGGPPPTPAGRMRESPY